MSGTASGCQHTTFCHVCERVILLTTMGIKAVDSHMKSELHRIQKEHYDATRK